MSFLEKLPREIRDNIYEYVYESYIKDYSSDFYITWANVEQYSSWLQSKDKPKLALLNINQQIRDEASSTLFGKATIAGRMTHIFPFLEAIGQHRDKLQSIKLHVDFGCCSHAVFDYNPRGYEAMRRTLSLLFSSKPLLMLSLDTEWVCYDEIGDNLMANGFDWLRNIVESRGDRIHDNCKADQGKANVRRRCVFPIRFLRAWSCPRPVSRLWSKRSSEPTLRPSTKSKA